MKDVRNNMEGGVHGEGSNEECFLKAMFFYRSNSHANKAEHLLESALDCGMLSFGKKGIFQVEANFSSSFLSEWGIRNGVCAFAWG